MIPDYNDLLVQEQEFHKLLSLFKKTDQTDLIFAYEFAKNAHGEQERDEGGRYIIHPLRVALILTKELGLRDVAMIRAALLHDVVEDTPVALTDIQEKFGERVASLVRDLTRERPDDETEAEKRINKPAKIRWYMEHAPRASTTIKCADILDNMRSWRYVTAENKNFYKLARWLQEAEELYLPLATMTDPYFVREFEQLLAQYKRG